MLLIYLIKNEYVIHIRNLKQVLNHKFILKTIHRVIRFIQKDLLEPYTDMNAKLRRKGKSHFEKEFFKLMKIAVLGKAMENVRKCRDIKLVTTKRKKTI